jgi:hypothetical protein
MSLIGDKLIKIFGGDDVYLGKVEPSETSKPKKKSNILKSVGGVILSATKTILEVGLPNPFQVVSRRKREEELQLKQKKLETIKRIKQSNPTNHPFTRSRYEEMAKQKWIDNIDRPDLSQGREYLQNIKKAVVKHQASPSQITETLFRDTFRKKQFSENNITTLWAEYNTWVREYKSKGNISFR